MSKVKRDSAYFLVDLAVLSAAQRAAVLEDAMAGGQEYGVIVVEEHVNGPARQPIYGVYYDTDETPIEKQAERKWTEAKATFGLADAADGSADEQALREQAQQQAEATADAANAAEEAAVVEIAGEAAKPNKAKR